MTDDPKDTAEKLLRKLVEIANGPNQPKNRAELKRVIDEHDLVFAIWQDLRCPDGIDYLLVKGSVALAPSTLENVTVKARTTAIGCHELQEAVAMREVFGDYKRQH